MQAKENDYAKNNEILHKSMLYAPKKQAYKLNHLVIEEQYVFPSEPEIFEVINHNIDQIDTVAKIANETKRSIPVRINAKYVYIRTITDNDFVQSTSFMFLIWPNSQVDPASESVYDYLEDISELIEDSKPTKEDKDKLRYWSKKMNDKKFTRSFFKKQFAKLLAKPSEDTTTRMKS